MNNELIKLDEWFRVNKLSLNLNKTKFMLFGKKGVKIKDNAFSIDINNVKIERVQYTKFLGIFIDEMLNWKYHLSQVSTKTSKSLGVLNKIKQSVY